MISIGFPLLIVVPHHSGICSVISFCPFISLIFSIFSSTSSYPFTYMGGPFGSPCATPLIICISTLPPFSIVLEIIFSCLVTSLCHIALLLSLLLVLSSTIFLSILSKAFTASPRNVSEDTLFFRIRFLTPITFISACAVPLFFTAPYSSFLLFLSVIFAILFCNHTKYPFAPPSKIVIPRLLWTSFFFFPGFGIQTVF